MSDGFFMATSCDAGLRLDELKIRWNAFVDEQPIPSVRKRFPAKIVVLEADPVESVEQADAHIRNSFLNVWKQSGDCTVVKDVAIAVRVLGEVPKKILDVTGIVHDARAIQTHMHRYLSGHETEDMRDDVREQLRKAARDLRDFAETTTKAAYRERHGIKPIIRIGMMAP